MNLFNLKKELRLLKNNAASELKAVLKSSKKVATGKTTRSIEGIDKPFGYQIRAGKSLLFIEKGRRPGGKMPVFQNSSGKFELFPELSEWKKAKGVKIPDFALAKGIATKGIPPTPIFDAFINKINDMNESRIKQAFKADIIENSTLNAKRVFLK